MSVANIHPAQIILLFLFGLLSSNCLAVDATPSLATQRLELETETRAIKESTALEQRRIEELNKLIDELSNNNAALEEQLQQHLQELEQRHAEESKKLDEELSIRDKEREEQLQKHHQEQQKAAELPDEKATQ